MGKLARGLVAFRKKYGYHHASVFLLTFFSYALLHVTRKSFSNIKSVLQQSWTPSNHTQFPGIYPPEIWDSEHFFTRGGDAELFLGYLDTTFLFCYAVGLYISGIVGDRFNLRYVLCTGMLLSALVVFFFGSLGPWLNIRSRYYYGVLWGLNDFLQSGTWVASFPGSPKRQKLCGGLGTRLRCLVQSSGWPTVVAIMGNWFGKESHGVVFGIWSANASVGNIFGALLVSALLPYGFQSAMMAAAFLLFLGAVVNLTCLVEHPSLVGLVSPRDSDSNGPAAAQSSETQHNIQDDETKPLLDPDNGSRPEVRDQPAVRRSRTGEKKKKGKAINFFSALLIPGVIVYSLSYACLKLVNYSLFFWLPYYLSNRYSSWATPEESDRLSTLYDLGGIVGGAVGGFISDRLGKRSPVVVTMLLTAVAAIFVYQGFGSSALTNGILMTVAGIFIGGPANLESSAITADLGKQSAVKGNVEALATVTGIVDGTGSVGAAIGQTLVALIQEKTGEWKWVFYFLMAMLASSALFLVDLFVRDTWSLLKSARHRLQTWQRQRLERKQS